MATLVEMAQSMVAPVNSMEAITCEESGSADKIGWGCTCWHQLRRSRGHQWERFFEWQELRPVREIQKPNVCFPANPD